MKYLSLIFLAYMPNVFSAELKASCYSVSDYGFQGCPEYNMQCDVTVDSNITNAHVTCVTNTKNKLEFNYTCSYSSLYEIDYCTDFENDLRHEREKDLGVRIFHKKKITLDFERMPYIDFICTNK